MRLRRSRGALDGGEWGVSSFARVRRNNSPMPERDDPMGKGQISLWHDDEEDKLVPITLWFTSWGRTDYPDRIAIDKKWIRAHPKSRVLLLHSPGRINVASVGIFPCSPVPCYEFRPFVVDAQKQSWNIIRVDRSLFGIGRNIGILHYRNDVSLLRWAKSILYAADSDRDLIADIVQIE